MEEVLHNVSKCCKSPCKYRKGQDIKGEEVFIPFCCECEQLTEQIESRLSRDKKEENKKILMKSIFPGMEGFLNNIKNG